MIILRTPKGWTGPKEVDGMKTEGKSAFASGSFRRLASKPHHLKMLEDWMRSYKPEELLMRRETCAGTGGTGPKGERRMGANPHANGGPLPATEAS